MEQPESKDVRQTRVDLPSPKRGAFPTPKAEIESATPYIPDSDQAGDESATEPVSRRNADQEDNSRSNFKATEPR
jgi:hypothetical protein